MPANIESNLCTHLIYAFSGINDANELVAVEWNDNELYKSFNGLKQRYRPPSRVRRVELKVEKVEYVPSPQKSKPENTAGSRRMELWNSQVRCFWTRAREFSLKFFFRIFLSAPDVQIHHNGVNTNQQKPIHPVLHQIPEKIRI